MVEVMTLSLHQTWQTLQALEEFNNAVEKETFSKHCKENEGKPYRERTYSEPHRFQHIFFVEALAPLPVHLITNFLTTQFRVVLRLEWQMLKIYYPSIYERIGSIFNVKANRS